MTNAEFWGYVVVFCIPVLGSIAALIKPLINLNVSIQKLYDLISQLNTTSAETKEELTEHANMLHDHEQRIRLIEYKEDIEK